MFALLGTAGRFCANTSSYLISHGTICTPSEAPKCGSPSAGGRFHAKFRTTSYRLLQNLLPDLYPARSLQIEIL